MNGTVACRNVVDRFDLLIVGAVTFEIDNNHRTPSAPHRLVEPRALEITKIQHHLQIIIINVLICHRLTTGRHQLRLTAALDYRELLSTQWT
jgi:hypothetical protein